MSVGRFRVLGFRFAIEKYWQWVTSLALATLWLGAPGAAAESLQARLVNKEPLPGGPVSFYTGQVEVTLADGTKRLLPHRSYLEPQVAGNRVIFLPTEGLRLTRILVYEAETDKTRSYRLPVDLDPVFGSPSFSPDGNKLAYYLPKSQRVIVRHWPSLKILRKSDKFPVRPTDVPPMPPVWTGPDKVQFDPLFFLPERQVSFSFP